MTSVRRAGRSPRSVWREACVGPMISTGCCGVGESHARLGANGIVAGGVPGLVRIASVPIVPGGVAASAETGASAGPLSG